MLNIIGQTHINIWLFLVNIIIYIYLKANTGQINYILKFKLKNLPLYPDLKLDVKSDFCCSGAALMHNYLHVSRMFHVGHVPGACSLPDVTPLVLTKTQSKPLLFLFGVLVFKGVVVVVVYTPSSLSKLVIHSVCDAPPIKERGIDM